MRDIKSDCPLTCAIASAFASPAPSMRLRHGRPRTERSTLRNRGEGIGEARSLDSENPVTKAQPGSTKAPMRRPRLRRDPPLFPQAFLAVAGARHQAGGEAALEGGGMSGVALDRIGQRGRQQRRLARVELARP